MLLMSDPFDSHAHQIHFNRALGEFHSQVAGVAKAINEEIASRPNIVAVGYHPKVKEAFELVNGVVDEVLGCEDRAAQFQLKTLKARGVCDSGSVYSKGQEEKLLRWVCGQLRGMPESLVAQCHRLSCKPRALEDLARVVEGDVTYRIRREYGERRAELQLLVEATQKEESSTEPVESDRATKVTEEEAPPLDGPVFKKVNDSWTIGYAGQVRRGTRDVKALGDVHCLLKEQGRKVKIEDLPVNVDCQLQTRNVGVATEADAMSLVKKMQELRNKRPEAERGQVLSAQDALIQRETDEELEGLRRQFSENFDKYGHPRQLAGDREKMIASTKKRYKRLLKRIMEFNLQLHQHLDRAITIDVECSYAPENDVEWDLGD
jgi:hypothetical protein